MVELVSFPQQIVEHGCARTCESFVRQLERRPRLSLAQIVFDNFGIEQVERLYHFRLCVGPAAGVSRGLQRAGEVIQAQPDLGNRQPT